MHGDGDGRRQTDLDCRQHTTTRACTPPGLPAAAATARLDLEGHVTAGHQNITQQPATPTSRAEAINHAPVSQSAESGLSYLLHIT